MLLNKSGQEGLILWPCSGPLTRFLQDYVQALFKGQFSPSLLPKSTVGNNPHFHSPPTLLQQPLYLKTHLHAEFPEHLIHIQKWKIDGRRKKRNHSVV